MNQHQFIPPSIQLISLLSSMFLLFACKPDLGSPQNQYCLNEKEACFDLNQNGLKMVLGQPLKIEQPIKFKIELPHGWKINQSSARLVGANMYMGRIPVPIRLNDAHDALVGELLIIACTRPDMVWQFELEVELQNGQLVNAHWPFLMTNTE